jgi:putative component of membrane protein insertase Oxa1/YidC/SpoIIIJ protein YidD
MFISTLTNVIRVKRREIQTLHCSKRFTTPTFFLAFFQRLLSPGFHLNARYYPQNNFALQVIHHHSIELFLVINMHIK